MKKSVLVIWVLIIALFLSACVQNDTTEPNPTNADVFIDRVIPTCRTLEAYNAWVEGCTYLPDNYIHFSELEHFGEFGRYAYWVSATEEITPYLYHGIYYVTDANGVEFSITGNYNAAPINYRETLTFDETVPDMRNHPSGKSGTVYRDGINYKYNKGKLMDIIVVIDGLEIVFGQSADLYDYPMSGEDTPLKRLLSADIAVASAVVEELAAKLAQ